MTRRRIVYQEKYKVGAARLPAGRLPTFPALPDFDVIEAEVRSAGTFDDGTEFQDIRVVLKERT